MHLTKRAFILALAAGLGAQDAVAAKPTIFDFYEYVQRRKAASDAPHEEPWIPARIRAIDHGRRQMRVTHAPALSFKMPTMTMTLGVAENVDLAALRLGAQVDIRIGKRDGRIEVVEVRMRRP